VTEPVDTSDLAWQKTRYRNVFDSIHNASLIVEDDMTISLVNAMFEVVTGYGKGEIEGKKRWTDLVVKNDLERLEKYHNLRRVDPGIAPDGYELQFKDKNGAIKSAFVSVSMIPGTKKDISSIFNVTEIDDMGEQMEGPNADDSDVAIESKGVTLVPDWNVRFIFTSSKLIKLVEEACSKRTERSVITFFPRTFSEKINDTISRVYEEHKSSKYDSPLHMGGRNMEVQVHVVPILDKKGAVDVVLVTMNDVTFRKRAERTQLEDLALGDLNIIRNEFITNLSHELRTPLNNIIGYSEMLLDQSHGKVNKRQTQQLISIHTSGMTLLELINDFLDLSLIEMDEIKPVSESFTLYDVVKDIFSICEPLAKSGHLTVKIDVDDGIIVWADQTLVKQCLYNLLMNAIKFTPSGGRITIKAAEKDGNVTVSVKDDGMGIPIEKHGSIFQPFLRMKIPQTGEVGNTGFGLTITQKLVELMDGTAWLESTDAKEKGFYFTLPAKPPSIG